MADIITKLGFIDLRAPTYASDRDVEADNRVQPDAIVDASPKQGRIRVVFGILRALGGWHTQTQRFGGRK